MDSPIITVVSNQLSADRTLYWTGEGAVWIGANASVELPYEVWSKADRQQRQCIIADCQSKAVSLTVKVMGSNGKYTEMPFDPSGMIDIRPIKINVPQEKTSEVIAAAMQEDIDKHTITAGSADTEKAAAVFGAVKAVDQPMNAASVTVEGPHTSGFVVDPSVVSTMDKIKAAEAEAAKAATEHSKEEPTVNLQSVKQDFDAAVAVKDWNAALKVLIEAFGADKVTFTARTIMSMKDFDAIVEKYGLDKA